MAAWLLVYRSSMTDPPPVREDWAEREARGTTGTRRDAYACPERECVFLSASLRVMVAHVTAHREPDREAGALSQARIAASTRRIRASLAQLPDPDVPPPPDQDLPDQSHPCACGCGTLTTRPRYASDECQWGAANARRRARKRARERAGGPAVAVAAHAGLASAAGTAPQPAAAVAAVTMPCACGCGLPVTPARGPGNRRKFATRACGKRQQRRDERQRYRELIAASVPWPPVPPASAAAVTTVRSLATVR